MNPAELFCHRIAFAAVRGKQDEVDQLFRDFKEYCERGNDAPPTHQPAFDSAPPQSLPVAIAVDDVVPGGVRSV